MVLTVRNKNCGSIYYITEKMYNNSRDVFELVEEVVPQDTEEEGRDDEDVLEALREELRKREIPFHPLCGEKKLREKLEESE